MPGQTRESDTGDANPVSGRRIAPGAVQEPQHGDGQSYGAIVWKQFRKRPSAVVGLAIVWFLLTAAVLAPFIANEVPYYWAKNGELSFPVLAYLSNLELCALVAYILAMLLIIIAIVKRRGGKDINLSRLAGIMIGIWLILTIAAFGFRRAETRYGFYLERRAEATHCMFPPVAYARTPGYAELAWRDTAPSRAHPLGTGRLGDDILIGIIYGTRTAMTIGFVAVGISVSIGVCLGALSGYILGGVDMILMRLVEILMCMPRLILIIILVTVAPSTISPIWTVVVVLGLTGWTGVFRLMRAEMLRIRSEDYMTAGKALGLPRWRLLLRHGIPNGLAPILVSATFGIAGAVFLEASLSFLNLVQTPSWGEMLNDGRQHLEHWWVWAASGGAIFITVFVYNLVGEGLRDAIDPRLKISGT